MSVAHSDANTIEPVAQVLIVAIIIDEGVVFPHIADIYPSLVQIFKDSVLEVSPISYLYSASVHEFLERAGVAVKSVKSRADHWYNSGSLIVPVTAFVSYVPDVASVLTSEPIYID